MTGLERCLITIDGKLPDRIPVIPQDSLVAAKLAGFDQIEFSRDAKKRASAIIGQRDKFGFDGCIMGDDTVCLAEAVGVEVIYSSSECPRWKAGILEDYNQVDRLKLPNPQKDGRLPVWIEAVKLVSEKIGNQYLMIARADQGAFSLASMIRGMEDFMVDLAMAKYNSELKKNIHKLLKFCNECQYRFIIALIDAGAHVVTTGDSISGPSVCSPETYYEFSWPYEKDMANRCKKLGIPFSIHICGYTDPIIPMWLQTGAQLWEIDQKTNFVYAREQTRKKVTIIGNLDPSSVMQDGDPDKVMEEAKKIIDITKPDCNLILSSGCLLAKDTPEDNLFALLDSSKRFGVY